MNESELYKELGALTKDKGKWEGRIPYVSSLLAHEFVKIQCVPLISSCKNCDKERKIKL